MAIDRARYVRITTALLARAVEAIDRITPATTATKIRNAKRIDMVLDLDVHDFLHDEIADYLQKDS